MMVMMNAMIAAIIVNSGTEMTATIETSCGTPLL